LASKELEKFAGKYPAWPKTGATLGGWVRRGRQQVGGKSQRRWYFLKDKFLFYYREPTDTMPLSGYVVENAAIAQTSLGEGRDLTQFSFAIPPSVDYIIDALDEKARAEWISVLSSANLIDPFEKDKKYFADALETVSSSLSASSSSSSSSQQSRATSGESVTREEYLYKRGSTNTDWKTRWFSLRGTLLIYSEREGSKALGSIDVRSCKIRQGEDGDAENPFQLVTPMRTYYIDSESAETTRKWIVAIFNAQENSAKISTEGILPSSSIETPYELESDASSSTARRNRASIFGVGKSSSNGDSSKSPGGSASKTSPSATKQRTTTDGTATSSTSGSDTSPSSSPSPSPGLKVVTIGRRLGGDSSPSSSKSSSSWSRATTHSAGSSSKRQSTYEEPPRTRPSSLKASPTNMVELTELKPPRESMVALSSLNESEEARRNRLVLEARRLERTHSEMLNEPLLMNEDSIDDDEAAIVGNPKEQLCSCCTIS
jgi:hypothetical protein